MCPCLVSSGILGKVAPTLEHQFSAKDEFEVSGRRMLTSISVKGIVKVYPL